MGLRGIKMNKYAVIEDNKVVNVIIAEDLASAIAVTDSDVIELLETDKAHIGLGYLDGEFEQPNEPVPVFEDVTTGTE